MVRYILASRDCNWKLCIIVSKYYVNYNRNYSVFCAVSGTESIFYLICLTVYNLIWKHGPSAIKNQFLKTDRSYNFCNRVITKPRYIPFWNRLKTPDNFQKHCFLNSKFIQEDASDKFPCATQSCLKLSFMKPQLFPIYNI